MTKNKEGCGMLCMLLGQLGVKKYGSAEETIICSPHLRLRAPSLLSILDYYLVASLKLSRNFFLLNYHWLA